MAGLQFFDRELRLATAGLEPDAINAALAKFARAELAKAIAEGASPEYDRFVNGALGAPEESVKVPGAIVYEFVNWNIIISAALAELVKRSPRRTGVYAGSFIVLANGAPVTAFGEIPGQAEVIIFNPRPQTRRIEDGANKSTGKKHFTAAKRALSTKFRDVFHIETRFVNVKAGVHPLVPYHLKGSQGGNRQPGSALTYPAIVINVL